LDGSEWGLEFEGRNAAETAMATALKTPLTSMMNISEFIENIHNKYL